MSNFYYFTDKTPEYRSQRWDATSTLSIWTPRAGNAAVLTGLTVTNNGAAGTFIISLGTTNTDPVKVCQFTVGASATISPIIEALASTGIAYSFWGRPAAGGTDTWHTFATGFEVGDN